MIKNKITGKHPNFIGPTLVHHDRKYGTYYYFASEVKKMRPSMHNLVATGTGGEEALSSAFLSVFPRTIHLQCSLHKRKLRELKVNEMEAKNILSDVFGSQIDDTYFEGLINSVDYKDFMEKVEMLRVKWDSMCPGFMEWFCTTQAEVMCTTMIVSVRTRAGLGSPPEHFTTNSNESLNNLLKRKVDFKRSEWPQFNRILQGAVKEQQDEFEKAIFGMGEYELVDEFKYLEVPHDKWIQMNVEQRKQKIQKACSAKVQDSTGVLLALSSTENAESSSHKCLSVSIDDAKIGHVSQERIKGMWDKAEQLLNTEGFILPAAGAANTARQVASLTGQKSGKFEIPHNVCAHKHPEGMEVKCDCPVYQSAPNICQHALAAAEDLHILSDYLLWVRKTKKNFECVSADIWLSS